MRVFSFHIVLEFRVTHEFVYAGLFLEQMDGGGSVQGTIRSSRSNMYAFGFFTPLLTQANKVCNPFKLQIGTIN